MSDQAELPDDINRAFEVAIDLLKQADRAGRNFLVDDEADAFERASLAIVEFLERPNPSVQ